MAAAVSTTVGLTRLGKVPQAEGFCQQLAASDTANTSPRCSACKDVPYTVVTRNHTTCTSSTCLLEA
jgi:hypothetical protein